jgi:hypothetical protein
MLIFFVLSEWRPGVAVSFVVNGRRCVADGVAAVNMARARTAMGVVLLLLLLLLASDAEDADDDEEEVEDRGGVASLPPPPPPRLYVCDSVRKLGQAK